MARRLQLYPETPLILMYHRVADLASDPWGLAVPPLLFEEQLAFLKHRRLVLPLAEFGQLHECGRLPAKAIAITFDDGYACNATTAAPLLEKYGLPATIFLATAFISSDQEFWWDALERIVMCAETDRLGLVINGTTASIALGRRDERSSASCWAATMKPESTRQSAYLKLWSRLRVAGDRERRQAIEDLHRQAGTSASPRQSHRIITAAEVRRIASSGLIEIGAHTVTHPVLNQLNREEQRLEITQSRDRCRELVGHLPKAFAYPFGEYDDDSVAIVKEAGFDIACTTQSFGIGASSRVLQMPRSAVGAWNASELAAAMYRLNPEERAGDADRLTSLRAQ